MRNSYEIKNFKKLFFLILWCFMYLFNFGHFGVPYTMSLSCEAADTSVSFWCGLYSGLQGACCLVGVVCSFLSALPSSSSRIIHLLNRRETHTLLHHIWDVLQTGLAESRAAGMEAPQSHIQEQYVNFFFIWCISNDLQTSLNHLNCTQTHVWFILWCF